MRRSRSVAPRARPETELRAEVRTSGGICAKGRFFDEAAGAAEAADAALVANSQSCCKSNTLERTRVPVIRPLFVSGPGSLRHCAHGIQPVNTARVSEVAGASVAHTSHRHRRLIQPTTVRLPSIRTDTRACAALVSARLRRAPVQPRIRSMTVKVMLEIEELHLQIRSRPEEGAVQT